MEEWREIADYEGIYSISSMGRVRRDKRGQHTRPGLILKPELSRDGYERVQLRKDGKIRHHSVHTLVAEAFLGPRPEGFVANHLDAVKRNNTPSNLEWATVLENAQHARRLGLIPSTAGERNGMSKLTTPDVIAIHEALADGVRRSELAAHFGVNLTAIDRIAIGKRWRHLHPTLANT